MVSDAVLPYQGKDTSVISIWELHMQMSHCCIGVQILISPHARIGDTQIYVDDGILDRS